MVFSVNMNSITAIFPKARTEILRLLFADPAAEFHLRELCRRSGLTLGTIQNEVDRLTQAGLLMARRDGNRLYYHANTQHPIFPELQSLALKTTRLRKQLADALSGVPSIELAFVFGSAAAGSMGAASDVDLFIVGKAGLRTLVPRLRPVALSLGREINPYVVSRETLETKAKAEDAFITNVLASPKIWVIGEADELGKLG